MKKACLLSLPLAIALACSGQPAPSQTVNSGAAISSVRSASFPQRGAIPQYNPLVPDNIADPSIVLFKDTFYLYATTDIDKELKVAGPPVVWKSTDFVNWHFDGILQTGIDWSRPYAYTNAKGQPATGYFRFWAPGKVIEKNDRYYLFVTIVSPDNKERGYEMIADKPEGPFFFTNGDGFFFNEPGKTAEEARPLLPDIDGEPFVDDDGSTYIYWRRRHAAALTDDLLHLRGDTISISTSRSGYSEGPGLFKRGDLYYYFYTLSGYASYCNAYMIGRKSPLGPFETPAGKNVFIFSDTAAGVWGPGHGNVFHMPGTDDYIFVYLEYGEGSTTRQVFANRMHFNPDGTLQPVRVDKLGVGYLGQYKRIVKTNLALTARVTASSYRPPRVVNAKIDPDPDLVAQAKDTAGASPAGKEATTAISAGVSPLPAESLQSAKVTRTFTYIPENAADGSNGTRWWADESDTHPWIQFDLGKTTQVGSCEMAFIFPTFGHAWQLEKSLDGKKWTVCAATIEPRICSPHVATRIGKARYLRISILKGTPGLWECRIYP